MVVIVLAINMMLLFGSGADGELICDERNAPHICSSDPDAQ